MVSKVEPGSSSPPLDQDKCPKFIESRKGKKLLVFDGYIFHLNTKNKATGYFKCSQTRKGCGARIVLKKWNQNNYTFDGYEITNGNHVNHLPDFEKIKKKKSQVKSDKAQDLNSPEFLNSKHVCLFCLSSLPSNYHLKTSIMGNVAPSPSGKELTVVLDNPAKNSQAFDLLCSLLNLKWRRHLEGQTFNQSIPLPLCLKCQHLYQEVFQLHIQIRELEILINKRIKVIRDLVEKPGEIIDDGSGETQLAFLGLDNFRRKVRDLTFNEFGYDADETETPTTSTTVTKIEPEVPEDPIPASPSSPHLEQPIVKQEVNPEEDNFQDNFLDTEENFDFEEDHYPSPPKKEVVPPSISQHRTRSTRLSAQRATARVTTPNKYTSSVEDNDHGDSDAKINVVQEDSEHISEINPQFTPLKPRKRPPSRPTRVSSSLSRPIRYLQHSGAPSSKTSRQYKCHICSTILPDPNSFALHIKTEHPSLISRYSCKFCNRKFPSLYKVTLHQHTHTGEKPFKCPHCPFATLHSQSLPSHILNKHSSLTPKPSTIPCPQCPKKFPTDAILQNHLIASHNQPHHPPKLHKKSGKPVPTLQCHLCPFEVIGQGPFLQHYSDIHPTEKRFTCKFCNLHFKFIREVIDHQRRHTGERPFKCDKCDKSFVALKNLQSHQKNRHPNPNNLQTFSCSKCPKKFPYKGALSSHLNSCHSDSLAFCKSCGVSFRFKCQFTRHNDKVHSGTAELSQPVKEIEKLEELGIKPRHKCHICWKPLIGGKIFVQKHFTECHPDHEGGLNTCQCGKKLKSYWRCMNHAMRHNTERKELQCDQCPHKSYSMRELNLHKATHVPVEERRGLHVCDKCGLGLVSKGTLWQHRKICGDEEKMKRWICDKCGRGYREKRGLDDHVKIKHLRILGWKCGKCEKRFGRRSILRRHERSHGGKEFRCGRCEMAFVHPGSRTRHEREVHGDGGKGKKRRKKGGALVEEGGMEANDVKIDN